MLEILHHFNGIDAERGTYFEPPMAEEEFLHRLSERFPMPRSVTAGVRLDVCPDTLGETGWGILWPGRADEIIERALAPLLTLRQAQCEESGPGRFWSFEYRGETGEGFLSQHGASLGGHVLPRRFPYYLLLLGDPSQIPFEFQHRLSRHHLVGRLCLDSSEAYASYAANAVAVEEGSFRRPRRAVVFGAHHADDPATETSMDHLVRPVLGHLAQVGGWRVEGVQGSQASKQRLLNLLGGDETPSLLFTAGHAVCYRPESKVLTFKQGGLLCSDWPGPLEWSGPNAPEHFLIAADIKESADLRGLVSFHFGCFTAGTPIHDSFPDIVDEQVVEGKRLAPAPFIAALPKRLLGHPRSALACIGHVDRAWLHSFHWGAIPAQTEAFESAFRGLMSGARVGRAMAAFSERRGAVAEEVMAFWLRREPLNPELRKSKAELWIRYHDTRSYILLGDPAARIPSIES